MIHNVNMLYFLYDGRKFYNVICFFTEWYSVVLCIIVCYDIILNVWYDTLYLIVVNATVQYILYLMYCLFLF